jgi:histone deacetylase 1/2
MADIPRIPIDDQMDDIRAEDDLIPPDERRPQRLLDYRRQADGELSDSDDEGEGGRRDIASHREGNGVVHAQPAGRPPTGIMRTGSTGGAGPSSHGQGVVLTTLPATSEDPEETKPEAMEIDADAAVTPP